MLVRKRRKQSGDDSGGAPAWMVTFADLMSLLLTFFIVLLSLSELDVQKYKAVAGSMKQALGLQADSESENVPKARPHKTDNTDLGNAPGTGPLVHKGEAKQQREQALKRKTQDFERIRKRLQHLVEQSLLHIEERDDRLVIRIQEKGAFRSGRAALSKKYGQVLNEVGQALAPATGIIEVAGHTDDIPISSGRYRSNWDLSSARAVSVVHQLGSNKVIAPQRLIVQSFGATRPVVPNVSDRLRAMNRRVEISLVVPNEMLPYERAWKAQQQALDAVDTNVEPPTSATEPGSEAKASPKSESTGESTPKPSTSAVSSGVGEATVVSTFPTEG